jgi:hypothetical protein
VESRLVPESKVELFAAIRRDSRVEGLSVRALADRYNVHRRTFLTRLHIRVLTPGLADLNRPDDPPPLRKAADAYDQALDHLLHQAGRAAYVMSPGDFRSCFSLGARLRTCMDSARRRRT